MSARRSRRKQDWPRGLYEPRDGYYTWRHPDGRTFVIGRVPLAVARNEALAANAHVADTKPGLVERLTGAANTIADVLDKMPIAKSRATAATYAYLYRVIREKLGKTLCCSLTVADCAGLIEGEFESGRQFNAKHLRSRLIAVCRRAMQLGWMETNPAEATASLGASAVRERLTLETFKAIYRTAPEVASWLQRGMLLALVTGQDRSTVVSMERTHIVDGSLIVWRSKTRKTNRPVAIPLDIRLDAVGTSLRDLVEADTGRRSKFLLHHITGHGGVPSGAAVSPALFTRAFAQARDLAGVGGKHPPSLHELRSLSKRLYDSQGGVDTKALLGHSSEQSAALYADPRGIEPVRVRIAPYERDVNKT